MAVLQSVCTLIFTFAFSCALSVSPGCAHELHTACKYTSAIEFQRIGSRFVEKLEDILIKMRTDEERLTTEIRELKKQLHNESQKNSKNIGRLNEELKVTEYQFKYVR